MAPNDCITEAENKNIEVHADKTIKKISVMLKLDRAIISAIKNIILVLIVTGIAYRLILIAIGQSIFHFQSNGSVVTFNVKAIGSVLLAQEFNYPKFFHPRPSPDSASGLDPQIIPENTFSQILAKLPEYLKTH